MIYNPIIVSGGLKIKNMVVNPSYVSVQVSGGSTQTITITFDADRQKDTFITLAQYNFGNIAQNWIIMTIIPAETKAFVVATSNNFISTYSLTKPANNQFVLTITCSRTMPSSYNIIAYEQ